MRGVVFTGERGLELMQFPDPTPDAHDVVIEMKASGMCGSDLHNYRAPAQPGGAVTGGIKRQAGVIAGHEPCGVVAAVGAGVTEKEARVGQRPFRHPRRRGAAPSAATMPITMHVNDASTMTKTSAVATTVRLA